MAKYRPNVAALILNRRGKLLICERNRTKGAWQFPQGGVDKGETLREALARELKEEIGLSSKWYKIIEKQSGYHYLYPPKIAQRKKNKHGFQGQEQTYFLCRLKKGAPKFDLTKLPQEFMNYKWIMPDEFRLKWLPDFKKKVHRQVFHDFFDVEL